jgi:hypothetical protein
MGAAPSVVDAGGGTGAPDCRRMLMIEVVQAHRLLDMLEAVQVGEWQAVDLPSGSAVITEQMVAEVTARHGDVVMRVWGGLGPVLDSD